MRKILACLIACMMMFTVNGLGLAYAADAQASESCDHKYEYKVIPSVQGKDGKKGFVCVYCGDERDMEVISKITSGYVTPGKREYNGMDFTPKVVILTAKGSLKEGEDYVLDFPEQRKDVGEYIVNIKLINDYEGDMHAKFYVTQTDFSKLTYVKFLTEEMIRYNGLPQEPEFDLGKFYLEEDNFQEGIDYTVNYYNNVKVGTARIVITGINNCTGSIEQTFSIYQGFMSSFEPVLEYSEVVYDGYAKYPNVIIPGLEEFVDYTVTYKDNINAGTATIRITGKGNCTGSVEKTFEIKGMPMTKITIDKTSYVYDGEKKFPKITAWAGDTLVVKDGLEVAGKVGVRYPSGDMIAPGVYSFEVVGIGNFSGSETFTYTILPKKPTAAKTELTKYNAVKISWKAPIGAKGYKVYYKKGNGKYKLLKTTTKKYANHTNLTNGKKYMYKIVPFVRDESGKIYESSEFSTVTATALNKVTNVKVVESGRNVKISWSNIDGESGYEISKSKTRTGTSVIASANGANVKNKKLFALDGKTYYYKVRAYKLVNGDRICGPWSEVKKFKK